MGLISIGETGGQGEYQTGQADYNRTLLGKSNDPDDREPDILNSGLCPKVGFPDPYDPLAYITNVSASRLPQNKYGWEISYQSSTDYQPPTHPLQKPASISLDSTQTTNFTTRDTKGNPIATTAGALIPVEYEDTRWVFNVRKQLATVPQSLLSMNNRLNSGSVVLNGLQCKKHTLMCKGVRVSDEQTELFLGNVVRFYVVSFQLHYRPEGFKIKVPNVDLQHLNSLARTWEH